MSNYYAPERLDTNMPPTIQKVMPALIVTGASYCHAPGSTWQEGYRKLVQSHLHYGPC